jgi:hypothetical protein
MDNVFYRTSRDEIKKDRLQFIERYRDYTDQKHIIQVNAVRALDPETCTAADLQTIIQAKHWGEIRCNVCDKVVDIIARIGDEGEDYGDENRDVCKPCLIQILKEFPDDQG